MFFTFLTILLFLALYDEVKRGLESLTLDLIHIILLPAAGMYYIYKLCRRTRTTLTTRKTPTL